MTDRHAGGGANTALHTSPATAAAAAAAPAASAAPAGEPVMLGAAVTRDIAREFAERGVTSVKVGATTAPDGLRHLMEVPTIRRLDLSRRRDFVDADIAFLAGMPQLTSLSLAGCRSIGDAGIEALRAHQALEEVELQDTATGDGAVTALAGKPSLAHVVLGNLITDAGVPGLREFPALRLPGPARAFLGVSSGTDLTDRALAAIGDLDGVVSLDLHHWVFGSRHFTDRGVAHLKRMASLDELNFIGDLATDAVMREIAAIPGLRILHCQDILSGDEGFLAMAQCVHLEQLWARLCHVVTDRGFAAFGRLPRLRKLCLGGQGISDGAIASLMEAPALTELWTFDFGDAAYPDIARLPRLDTLVNMFNTETTDAGTRHLKDHPRLVRYDAVGTQITDESLRLLAALPALESAKFEFCGNITDGGLRELARVPRLRKVATISCPRVTGDWVAAMPPQVETVFERAEAPAIDRYRFRMLLLHPDISPSELPSGDASIENTSAAASLHASANLLPDAIRIGCHVEEREDGVWLSSKGGGPRTRHVGMVTREVFAVPLRLDVIVKLDDPEELHLYFSQGELVFNESGTPHLGMHDPRTGVYYQGRDAGRLVADVWYHVTWEIGTDVSRVLVDGEVRQQRAGDFTDLRGRIGVGPRWSTFTLREMTVSALEPR